MERDKITQKHRIVDVRVYKAWSGAETALIVEVGIVGRDGTFKREWKLTAGRLTEEQELDCRNWVDALIGDSILLSLGVQQSLFL